MKRIIALVLVMTMILSLAVYAKDDTKNLNGKVYLLGDLATTNNEPMSNNSMSLQSQDEDVDTDIDYNIFHYELDNGYEEIEITGEVFLGDKSFEFNASSHEGTYHDIDGKEILIGVLHGSMDVNGEDKDIIISLEYSDEKSYMFFSINKLDDGNGLGLLKFGESSLSEKNIQELFYDGTQDNQINTVNLSSSGDEEQGHADVYVDGEWQTVADASTSAKVIRGQLYLEDSLAEGYHDGRVTSKFKYSASKIERELSRLDIRGMYCHKLYVSYKSANHESWLEGTFPSQSEPTERYMTYMLALVYDVGLPTLGASFFKELVGSSREGIRVSKPTDLYDRAFTITMKNNTDFMDYDVDIAGGYAIEVAVDHAINSYKDVIKVDGSMDIKLDIYDDGHIWGTVGTEEVKLQVDLADYK